MKASPVGMSHICTASDLAAPNLDSLAILKNLIELYTTNPGVYTQNTSSMNTLHGICRVRDKIGAIECAFRKVHTLHV
jgi:hypothetical protein